MRRMHVAVVLLLLSLIAPAAARADQADDYIKRQMAAFAAGIMLLVSDGRLRLDDPISEYLEGTPSAWAPITIRHLLTHTSGLVRESPTFDATKDQRDADVIKGAYAVPLRFVPGQQWEYSNTGYYALAETIHQVTVNTRSAQRRPHGTVRLRLAR